MNKTDEIPASRKRISLMGSTGSIGRQTLDVVSLYPELFEMTALTANTNWQLLASQALKFRPEMVVISDSSCFHPLKEALKDSGIEILCGPEGLVQAATHPLADIVVGALVGYSGLPSTIAALEAGKTVALANKETLVVAGEIIKEITGRKGKEILPVDSEHSAIFQCLFGEDPAGVSKLILTASGGPFLNLSPAEMENVTVKQALAHPNWNMGNKVTIDSATMMNKGFEMIEAKWLFNRQPRDIEILVHPESIIHSMVEFADGSVKAQLGLPNMQLPIEVALAYPERLDMMAKSASKRLDLAETGRLTFHAPDFKKFPLLRLAYEAAEAGGLIAALLNAANEVAVKYFLDNKIKFTDIFKIVEQAVEKGASFVEGEEMSLLSIQHAHTLGTDIAVRLINCI